MLGRSTRDQDADGSARQPLLDSADDETGHDSDSVLFSVDDDEDIEDSTLLNDAEAQTSLPKSGHSVRFQEDVQVIGPPLRSTFQSRETGA